MDNEPKELTEPEHDGCGHPWADHVLVATTGNPKDGGTWHCPVEECGCKGTWAPDPALRAAIDAYEARQAADGG